MRWLTQLSGARFTHRRSSSEESRVNSRLGPVSELTETRPLQRQGRAAASAATPRAVSETVNNGPIARLYIAVSHP